jgi:ATP-dependent DNA helicase Rep
VSLFEAVFMGGIEARLSARQVEPLRTFCEWMQRLSDRAARDPATTVLDDMMEAIHYEAYLYDAHDERQAQSKWQNVLEFCEWLKRKGTKPEPSGDAEQTGYDNADGFGDEGKNLLGLIQTVALMSMLEGKDEDPDAVRLSTVHASKGLEYPHVFLVGVEEGIMPHRGGASSDDGPVDEGRIEEELRLMYVAITRAQRSLHLNWCKKRKRARETVVCEPSRFIPEMLLDDAPPPTVEEAPMTPKDRMAMLKAMLQKG